VVVGALTRWDHDAVEGVRQLVRTRAEQTPATVFLQSARDGRVLTWSGLAAVTGLWAQRLADAGVPPGGVVALQLPDPLRFAAAYLAIIAAGRVVAPVDPAAGPSAARRHLDAVGASAVVRADLGAPDARDADGAALVDDLGGVWAAVGRERGAPAPWRDRGGVLLASSGTTGPPKLVELTETQLLHTAGGIAGHHRFTPADRGLSPLPLHHVNAQVVGLLTALVAGSRLVLDDRFHRTGFWDVVADRCVTWMNAVPAILAILASHPPGRPLAGVRFARSASAPLPVATLAAFEAATGIMVVETYGMTEAGSQITANPVDGGRRPGSVGRPVGVELQVVDPAGLPVSPDVLGRVRIRGAGVITAYAGSAGQDAIGPDGWLDTGDLGRVDADGFVRLSGRRDDIVNRGGEKILPGDVEEVLRADPDVADVVVVGWPDAVLGAVPVAAVVARPGPDAVGHEVLRARLHGLADARLTRPQRPVTIHLVDTLPTGVNGKVSRRAVLDDLRARMDVPARGEPG